ncbi:aldehyde dehydrogenase [Candidatus Sumerlaeota bacterium]|nr:aldehyde dehydrogenase [Candidatus Sumerlaeota bacterium]
MTTQSRTQVIRSINPFTEKVIGSVTVTSPADTRRAVARARAAQPQWASVPLKRRVALMEALAARLGEVVDDLAPLITSETGKPIRESFGEVRAAQARIRHICIRALRVLGRGPRIMDWERNLRGTVLREPLGVVAAITAWNYPVSVSCQVIASALLAGNTVVFKPSEMTALTGKRLGEIITEITPEDVFHQISGADATGRALVSSDIDMVGFVGSNAVGKAIMRSSADRLHRLALELGGKDPAIICHDADLAHVAKRMIGGALWNCGQECNSVERIYVDRRVEREFLVRLVAEVKKLRVGDPMSDQTDIGPMISAGQRRHVESHVADAVRRGAKALCGGKRPKRRGLFYPPTVLSGVDHSMRVMREETFGPVIPVMPFDTEEEAISLANDSEYGLTASVWTADLRRGERIARHLTAGLRAVNSTGAANPNFPWGGARQSGLGRLMGPDPFADFTDQRGLMVAL